MMEGLAMKGRKMKGKEAVAEVVGVLLASRTYAHLAHLKTGSYSKHKALDTFYTDIVDLADSIAEVAQGRYGKLDIPMVQVKDRVDTPEVGLENQLMQIERLRESCENKALNAIVDEVEMLYSKTLYKLKELA